MQWHVKPLDCQGSPRYLFILFCLFGCFRSQLQHAGTSVESCKLSVAAWGVEPGPLALGAQFQPLGHQSSPLPHFFLAWLIFNINQGTTESERGCCEQSGLGSPRNTSICDHHFTGEETASGREGSHSKEVIGSELNPERSRGGPLHSPGWLFWEPLLIF